MVSGILNVLSKFLLYIRPLRNSATYLGQS